MPADVIVCPHCSARLKMADPSKRSVRCPKCKTAFQRKVAPRQNAPAIRTPAPAAEAAKKPAPPKAADRPVRRRRVSIRAIALASLAVIGALTVASIIGVLISPDFAQQLGDSAVAVVSRFQDAPTPTPQAPVPWVPPPVPSPEEKAAPWSSPVPFGPEPPPEWLKARPPVVLTSRPVVLVKAQARAMPPVVVLHPSDPRAATVDGLLLREIARQAFLLAARDEFGLTTRDVTLGETVPDEWSEAGIAIYVHDDGGLRLTVTRRAGEDRENLGTVLGMRAGQAATHIPEIDEMVGHRRYSAVVEDFEAVSREAFCEFLKRAGWPIQIQKPPQAAGDGRLPDGVERQLDHLTYTAQFAAARALHAAARAGGESPQLLGALARAYAHLGVLTEFHWHPAHKVYKARALLYAQRLRARESRSPRAIWHRAYALALVGRHQDALDDLAEAAKLVEESQNANRPSEPQPEWVDLIDAYCRFDVRKLAGAPAGPARELALLLHYLAVEDPGVRTLTLRAGDAVLKANRECYRVHDRLADVGGVAFQHTGTVAPLQALTETMPDRLLEMPGLPAEAVAAVKRWKADGEPETERRATLALLEAGRSPADRGELSWGALGRLLQETRFTQVWRRLDFMAHKWRVPVGEFRESSRPLFADHPYRGFLDAVGVTDRGRAEGLLKDMAFVEPEVTIELLSARLTELNLQDSSGKPWDRASQNLDQVYPDYLIWSKSYQKSVFNKGKEALATSRFGPLGWAIQIQGDWDSVRGLGETWEKPFAGHPRVAAALALRYSDLKRWDEAERHLKRFIEWSPDYWAYELLAKNYLAQNKTEQWQQTLEESLTHEDFGLDHANAHVQLARHFMGQKQWAKARPHADAAAESGASWAMRCASECYEGLGQWDRAEHWMRQVSERYGTPDWFYWCKLTGRGNVQAAQRFAVGYLTARPDPADADDLVTFGQSWLLAGRPDQARKLLERAAQSGPPDHRVYAATLLALMADADGRADLRDQHLQRAAQAQSPLAELPRLFLDSHTRKARLDLQLVEGVLTKLSPQHATGLSFHVGRHLQLHRRQAEAAVYFQRSLAPANTDESVRALAGVALREGIR